MQYLGKDTISQLLKTLGVKNRIILFSHDNTTISQAYSSFNKDFDNSFIGLKIDQIINFDWKKEITDSNKIEGTGQLNELLLLNLKKNEAHFVIEKFDKYTMVTITMYPENRLEIQIPRILQLLTFLKTYYTDNSILPSTVMGNTISLEVNNIYNELLDYMENQQPNQDTY